ncbi:MULTISPECIES: IPTL-CTERM sorting domain-containing protein [unclassified Acidovorax]|uniref:IPTL-CTERM sorting domain-containing protein n=1 Tax=unclassified Acidovorax TaxID=2684926 RepID=UPI001C44EAF3|nr:MULTISPECIES: IPTL-CTERM sorting domain-containing protein [unclassified Acidovorax]MBV7430612.1 IPTL-CTERM sorting domain-containing protein [Acidovorax sp. sif0732]MBV7449036.1 IPTL-CTERM sorting domain-containing protein [Acidovorax sp. sif0715]
MKKHLALLALAAGTHAGAWAATYTYTYTGNPYTAPTLYNFTHCTVGNCGSFTTAMFQSGWFTTAAPLPPGLGNADISALVTGFAFSDGLTGYSSAAGDTLYSASADTDANGAFTDASLTFFHWETPAPHAVGDRVNLMGLHEFVNHNYECQQVPAPYSGVCTTAVAGTSGSYIDSHPHTTGSWLVTVLPAAPGAGVSAVPTLGEGGLLLLAAFMAGTGMVMRRKAPRDF